MTTSSTRIIENCAICLGDVMKGQAIFTAECSHSFHFNCIGKSVSFGNHSCPICRATWSILPFPLAPNIPPPQVQQPPPPEPEPIIFNDDEPLPANTANPTSSAGLQSVTIKSIPERPAIVASEPVSPFSVLVGVRAPPLLDNARNADRAPVDLVTVLDVSGSMQGSKLSLLKRAIHFVVDNLGPSDRLSIVSFSSAAQRIFPLRRMTENGREDAKRAVDSLRATGMTNIVEGLKKGACVLEERLHKNPVASVIFLSDGKDTCYRRPRSQTSLDLGQQNPDYMHLLAGSICPRNRGNQEESQQETDTFPVHTFGFGMDHDPIAMHAISDESGGTFSFIETYEMVQDAFASCIGGLLSIVAQELRITIRSASNGVEIISIPSGRYASEISDQGSQGVINVGDLYAEEEKEFLINLSVPGLQLEDEQNEERMSILNTVCSYKDVIAKEIIRVEVDVVEICRPTVVSPSDMEVNLEVDRQRNRLLAAEGIAEAQRMAEMGNLSGARDELSRMRVRLRSSVSGQAGDGLSIWLETELRETERRMGSREVYNRDGRAYALSGLLSHGYQRAATRGNLVPGERLDRGVNLTAGSSENNAGYGAYVTPTMVHMLNKSRQLNQSSIPTPPVAAPAPAQAPAPAPARTLALAEAEAEVEALAPAAPE